MDRSWHADAHKQGMFIPDNLKDEIWRVNGIPTNLMYLALT